MHDNQGTTWPIANCRPVFTPPASGPRAVLRHRGERPAADDSAHLDSPCAGTYLLESGTHPSIQGAMGLSAWSLSPSPPGTGTPGTAYPGVNYNADVPLLFSEIDPVQNNAVDRAVNTAGFNETATHSVCHGWTASINLISAGRGYTAAPTVIFIPAGGITHTAISIRIQPAPPTGR